MTFDDWIEAEREAFGVPGMAVGAIQDGKIVINEGFGLRDVDAGKPVTPDT
ncbi:MAG: beta-lactamase family protein, partial [Actinobacteria bacterium]|nr:beta-lactamase family protein [Actinomycetota bacterium]